MSFHKKIINTFSGCPIDNKFLGQCRNVRKSFEAHCEDHEKEFDKWVQHYVVLCKYNDFWDFEPGKFLYRFRTLNYKIPAASHLDDFVPVEVGDE